jgi:hypothetical protein
MGVLKIRSSEVSESTLIGRRQVVIPCGIGFLWRNITGFPLGCSTGLFSPYVAMHFATAEIQHMQVDAAIWCVDFTEAIDHLPKRLRNILSQEYTQVFTVEMLGKEAKSLYEFDRLSKEDFVLFFEPPSLDDRVVNQYALFSVMSNAEGLLNIWLEQHPELFVKIIVPFALKWEIRDKLDQANINERTMFPGLDGLSKWLTRHYRPGPLRLQETSQVPTHSKQHP